MDGGAGAASSKARYERLVEGVDQTVDQSRRNRRMGEDVGHARISGTTASVVERSFARICHNRGMAKGY
jgi:hypothetical protein